MKCPGQDTRYWQPGDIFDFKCPKCDSLMEFFKDDSQRTCKKCGSKVLNPGKDFGCATYCKYAKECLTELPPEILAERKSLLKDRVAIEMKRYFGHDFKRIGHACNVARYAEKILEKEGGDMAVVLISAYLHDIGIKEAEKKYRDSGARYQEELGPAVAGEILENLSADPRLIDEVTDIIGHHHHPKNVETDNFKVLYDADMIVNLDERQKKDPLVSDAIILFIESNFLTETGKTTARNLFLS